MMKKRKSRFRVRGSQIVSSISITMVLLVLGIVALTGIIAHRVADNLRSGIGMVVIVDELATDTAADSLSATLKNAPYTRQVTFASAEEVHKRWKEQLGGDELPDVNPFQPEYEVAVNAQWSSADSLDAIAARLAAMPAVYDVKVHKAIAANINRTVSTVMLVLLVVAIALLIISFVLIRNTVSMEVYAQRVIIHTMQYVGARPGFIRRPYVMRSMLSGIAAGVIASALLALLLVWVRSVNAGIADAIGIVGALCVFATLILIGAGVCALAATFAANKYLRRSYDEIFQ